MEQTPKNTTKKSKNPPVSLDKKSHPLLQPGSILSFWAEAADLLLQENNGDASLLYFHILRKGHGFPETWDNSRAVEAQLVLRNLGLYTAEACAHDAPPEKQVAIEYTPPVYSTNDVNTRLKDPDQMFFNLVSHTESLLGKSLTQEDIKKLLEIFDYIGFPVEVIIFLISWTITREEEKHGKGKRPTLFTVFNEAKFWWKKGINTYENAENYVQDMKKLLQWEAHLLRLFDLDRREFVAKEREFTNNWKLMNFPDEVLRYAYEITMVKKGKFDFHYANGILVDWHQKDYKTVEEIKVKDHLLPPKPQKGASVSKAPSGPNLKPKAQNGPRASSSRTENTSTNNPEEIQKSRDRRRAIRESYDQNNPSSSGNTTN